MAQQSHIPPFYPTACRDRCETDPHGGLQVGKSVFHDEQAQRNAPYVVYDKRKAKNIIKVNFSVNLKDKNKNKLHNLHMAIRN